MKERFRQWLNGEHDFLKDKFFNFDVTNDNNIQLVGWLFTLYSNFILFLEENNIKMDDKIIRFALERYIEEALKKKWNVQDVKNHIINTINSMNSNTSMFGMLFYVKGLEHHKEKLKELVEKNNPENFHAEDFDSRIDLNLSSTQGYYQAKKTLMRYSNQNPQNQEINETMLVRVLNHSKKYKFDLNLQDKNTVQKLMNDVKMEVNNNINIVANLQIHKIIHAICLGSTSRGTSPAQARQVDFWNLGDTWTKKAIKTKYSSFIGKFKSDQQYEGADYIKKGLGYIKNKIKTVNDLNTLYTLVVQKINDKNLHLAHLDQDAIMQTLLLEIKEVTLGLNNNEGKNVRAIALLSIIDGYDDLCRELKLDDLSDKIIELLIMKELHKLITQELISATQETKIELIYRSCVDLMSTMISLRLEYNDNQSKFTSHNNIITPAVINQSNLKNNTSHILVEQSGQHALNEGLKVLGFINENQLPKFVVNKFFAKNLPGFLLKSVLSKDKTEEEKDIAVYFEVGGKRDEARKVKENDKVACVGRISETIFDIDKNDIYRLSQDVIQWCHNDSDKPKVLCIDLTLTKPNDELVAWMQSPDIQELITSNKLDILVWQSEQKQHSLGTGKFSAGSVYLISGDKNKINDFNNKAIESYQKAPDNNLSTFFRNYCTQAMHEVVTQQAKSAKLVANQLNSVLDKHDAMAIANGPFVIIVLARQQKLGMKELLSNVWPESYSFGFSQTTITSWDASSVRISIGLESRETLEQQTSEIISKLASNSSLRLDG